LTDTQRLEEAQPVFSANSMISQRDTERNDPLDFLIHLDYAGNLRRQGRLQEAEKAYTMMLRDRRTETEPLKSMMFDAGNHKDEVTAELLKLELKDGSTIANGKEREE
jgi:hypothetical protein